MIPAFLAIAIIAFNASELLGGSFGLANLGSVVVASVFIGMRFHRWITEIAP